MRISGRRHHRLAGCTAVAVALVTSIAACSSDEDTGAPTDPCRATIEEAGSEAEISRQIELLDEALVLCSSVEVFAVHAQRHPTMLGWDVATYLTNRCATVENEGVRQSRICTSESVATTTPARVDAPEVVFVGTTLDGREVEIRPRAGRPFDDGVPVVIAEMGDLAINSGCEGLQAEFDRWSLLIEDPIIGDEASVFAREAQNVQRFIGCED